jgi:aldose sugar dehydrogenase
MQRTGLIGLGHAAAIVIAAGAVGCGGGSPPPSSSDPAGTGERITGNERLGWNQGAADANELAGLRYAAYIDSNNRVELTDVSCSTSGSGAFPCSSRLPQMSPGSHTLELVSFVTVGGSTAESPRSSPIRVNLVAATSGTDPTNNARASTEVTTRDGLRLRVDMLSDDLVSPTTVAFARDGRIFVGERRGSIRISNDASAQSGPAVSIPEPALVLPDVLVMGSEGGLLALALDPQFDRTHFVYALYTTAGADGAPRFRLARFRELAGRLGERVILLDDPSASPERPAGALGMGLDRKLYGAFDDGGDASRAQSLASYNGKVLRLNDDGTTPTDQIGSPVYSGDLRSPRGLDWNPATGALWLADAKSPEASELRVLEPGSARPTRAAARATIALPEGTSPASLAFYRGELMPGLRNDLLVAAANGSHLLRLRFDRRDSTRLVFTERLLEEQGIKVVAVGADGAVYLCTDRALLRLGPS